MKIPLTLEQIREMQGLLEKGEPIITLESNVILEHHKNRIGEDVGSTYRYEFFLVIEKREDEI